MQAVPIEPKQTDCELPEVVPVVTYRQFARSHEGVGGMFSQRRTVVGLAFHEPKINTNRSIGLLGGRLK
jgi:hypothetical protein